MKIQLKLIGLHCAGCVTRIENELKKTTGIKTISVNFATEKANLEFDEAKITLSKIKKIIQDLGYQAEEIISNQSQKQPSQNPYKIRFFFSLILGLPILYLSMGHMVGLPIPGLSHTANILLQWILSSIVILLSLPIWISGFKNLIRFSPNMDSLIFLGTASAYGASTLTAFIFKSGPIYFESTVMILVFISLGKYLETITKEKARSSIQKLTELQPQEAHLIKNKKEITIPISELKKGDIVLIKPGEKIPADGIIIEGFSAIDEKAITGESVPKEKGLSDKVIGATININGSLKVQITQVGANTVFAKIVLTVEEAMSSKAPLQMLADKISYYFVPLVMGIALCSGLVWWVLGYPFQMIFTVVIAVLIVACPCALGLATPIAVMRGAYLAAAQGILIKNMRALDMARKIDTIVFDKTGTLTKGELSVTKIISLNPKKYSKEDILKYAASLEKQSEHPIATAITKIRRDARSCVSLSITNFQAIPGKGIIGQINIDHHQKTVLCGTPALMLDHQIPIQSIEKDIQSLGQQGNTTLLLAINQEVIGVIALADTIKENAPLAITQLKANQKQVILLTGDSQWVGKAIAKELGINQVLSEVLPHEKAQKIKALQEKGHAVAMVGDGINDAPALAQADLGIALETGTDIAIETGDIILVKSDPAQVLKAIQISQYILKKIKQNLFWAFCYNIAGISVATGMFYPITGWILPPELAAGLMAFSSVSVILNTIIMKSK